MFESSLVESVFCLKKRHSLLFAKKESSIQGKSPNYLFFGLRCAFQRGNISRLGEMQYIYMAKIIWQKIISFYIFRQIKNSVVLHMYFLGELCARIMVLYGIRQGHVCIYFLWKQIFSNKCCILLMNLMIPGRGGLWHNKRITDLNTVRWGDSGRFWWFTLNIFSNFC